MQADAIFVQSIGSGGGNGGTVGKKLNADDFTLGGDQGSSGDGGELDITNAANLATKGDMAAGIMAQSVGAGGGYSGFGSLDGLLGGTGAAGMGGQVTVANTGGVSTAGVESYGLLVQSVGGGGGIVAGAGYIGGYTSSGAAPGGVVNVSNSGRIATTGANSMGVVVQSLGGGGGLSLGGQDSASTSLGGGAGDGGEVTLTDSGMVLTRGIGAIGVLAQSVGGGGGIVGAAGSGVDVQVATSGAGAGGAVNVTEDGLVHTTGAAAYGVVAQSVGGGGGLVAGGVFSSLQGQTVAAFAGGGGGSGTGGAVSVKVGGMVATSGQGASGVFAESVAGSSAAGPVSVDVSGTVAAASADGVQLLSLAPGGNGALGVTVDAGGAIVGQTAVAFTGGAGDDTLVNAGTIAPVGGVSGVAIDTGGRPLALTNSGMLAGGITGGGAISFDNAAGGVYAPGALLTLNGGKFTNAGTVSPFGVGTAVGTTTLTADYTQTSTGVININLDVTHPAMSKLVIAGKATLAGTLYVTPFDLATTAVATSTFTVFDALGGLKNEGITLDYQPSALLTYSFTVKGKIIRVNYGVEFSPDSFGHSGNDYVLGKAFDRVQTDGSKAFTGIAARFFEAPTDAALAALYDTLDGEGSTGMQQAAFAADDLYAHAVTSEIDDWRRDPGYTAAAGQPWTLAGTRLWAQAYGGQGGLAGQSSENSGALNYNGGGLAAGVDHAFLGRKALVGLGLRRGRLQLLRRWPGDGGLSPRRPRRRLCFAARRRLLRAGPGAGRLLPHLHRPYRRAAGPGPAHPRRHPRGLRHGAAGGRLHAGRPLARGHGPCRDPGLGPAHRRLCGENGVGPGPVRPRLHRARRDLAAKRRRVRGPAARLRRSRGVPPLSAPYLAPQLRAVALRRCELRNLPGRGDPSDLRRAGGPRRGGDRRAHRLGDHPAAHGLRQLRRPVRRRRLRHHRQRGAELALVSAVSLIYSRLLN